MTDRWWARANCLGLDPNLFFVERGATAQANKIKNEVCGGCDVVDQCLEDALAHDEHDPIGIAGGKTAKERRDIRAQRRRAAIHQESVDAC